ncbi:hypothetical protein K8I31_05075, partial [bacterium]|nr:hypothetical protein [bacterium]
IWTRVEGDFVFSIDDPYIGAYGSTPSGSDWQKMGIMARQSLDANSTYVFNLLRSSDQNLVQQRREVAGSDALSNDEYFLPAEWNLNWDPAADGILNPTLDDVTLGGTLVMAREDGVFFTSEYIDAGGERVILAGIELEMTDPIYIGVATTSHENPNLSQGIFKNPQLDGSIVAVKGWMLY